MGFSPDGARFFVVDYEKKVTVFETESQTPRYSLEGKFLTSEFNSDGKKLLIVSKKEISLLNVETGVVSGGFAKYKDEITFLGWNPNGKNFAVGAKNSTIEILDTETGKLQLSVVVHERKKSFFGRLFDYAFFRIAFTPDGENALIVSQDKTANLFDLNTGKILHSFQMKAVSPSPGESEEIPEITSIKFSKDGKWILTHSLYQNRLWETEAGNLIQEFDFSFPRFSPDSQVLGLVNEKNKAETAIYDLAKREIRPILAKYSGGIADWSSDGKYFITDRTTDEVSKNSAFIWRADTAQQTATIKTYSNHCFDFVSTCISNSDIFRFSSDNRILLSQNEKELKLINPENGETLFQTNEVRSPALWSPDGRYVLSNSKEKRKITLSKVIN